MSAMELVGYKDKEHLKRSFPWCYQKQLMSTFVACFDQFFNFQDVRGESRSMRLDLMRIANLVTGMARVAVLRTPEFHNKKNQNPKTKII